MLKIVKSIVHFIICKIVYRVEYINLDNLKKDTSYVICPNHTSNIDIIPVWAKTDNAKIMGKEELFHIPVIGYVFRKLGGFPIKRGKKDFSSIYHSVKIFEDENFPSLIIFPEGTRNGMKKNNRAKPGAVYIAATAEVEILPVYISEDKKIFKKFKVVFGKPYRLNDLKENIKDKKMINEKTANLMQKIYKLGEEYDGKSK